MKESLGPRYELSFRQLFALMALFILGVIAIPRGVDAAGQLMTIIDRSATSATAESSARVDNAGALHVLPSRRVSAFHKVTSVSETTPASRIAAVPSNVLVLTLGNGHDTVHSLVIVEAFAKDTSGNCPATPVEVHTLTQVFVPPHETVHLTYPDTHPLRSTAANPCMRVRLFATGSGGVIHVTVLGHRA